MEKDLSQFIRNKVFLDKVVSAEEAASWIEDGMNIGMSGFTLFGEPKEFPLALSKRGETEDFKINLYTGASLGPAADQSMAEAGIINLRVPYQGNPVMRKKINTGEIYYIDQHVSHTAEEIRKGSLGKIDYAIIEAAAITEEGYIIPTGSVGNSPIFVEKSENVIIELNTTAPKAYEGLHDILVLGNQGERREIPMYKVSDRIGEIGIKVDPDKVKGIVLSEQPDIPSPLFEPNEETQQIANNLLEFLAGEVKAGRLTESLAPLQSGVGSVANAVLNGMKNSQFKDIEVFSEVLQDGIFDLIDAGVVKFAAGTSFSLSKKRVDSLSADLEKYKDKVLFRPQEISNHPEIIRRLGVISFNTAIEVDIYGNVNSTHVSGTKVMNGIGGSGDFARNARITIFVTSSLAKDGAISTIVPFVSHVDHTEHDVDVIVTEQGYADLRGLPPVKRAEKLIEIAHPKYRPQLRDYFLEAKEKVGGHTPHILEKAFSFHTNLKEKGTMLIEREKVKNNL
ncbi:succinate CoA transferase [Lysinibacillus sp. OL1_EC]|uniref:succinate CoA transferase n=1 Tax=unclassified Lysinibacillus TaxID=2636778 RepID=UPI00103B4225|nr:MULTISPECIES: succinate CoA transferase [unclassified Lysinibacillus]MCM0627468.1 succinate CoA transferase [Lysinibacillus sp. OL1_EC]TBV86667.1 succinate CoA transferase [Lysinibacillus sp. OL1]UKJ43662.1 succinate CoA transferase [Lysinibacillus sp. ACHW1.5]WGT38190.1 succinate CoA transferase [Lysinibacillus sp. 1 U-2021]